MEQIFGNRLFELTRLGNDTLRKYEDGDSVNLDIYELQVLTMLKDEYLPFYEIADSLHIGEQSAFNTVKNLSDLRYIKTV